jgi:hypothetical protein
MGTVMKGLVKRGFTPAQFGVYLRDEVSSKMGAWRPRGAVLHNTDRPRTDEWPGKVKGKVPGTFVTITPEQRLDNMSVHWVAMGFSGCPHLVIAPDGMIWTAWPLWKPGTHSPSYSSTFWGVEMVGNFDVEAFPDALRLSTVAALAGLYAMLGHEPSPDTFHFHKEDKKTKHRNCPGKNVGTKQQWLDAIETQMHEFNPGEHA